jgi:hypothetical protein
VFPSSNVFGDSSKIQFLKVGWHGRHHGSFIFWGDPIDRPFCLFFKIWQMGHNIEGKFLGIPPVSSHSLKAWFSKTFCH